MVHVTTLKTCPSRQLYSFLISEKVVLARGVLHWCQELMLSDEQIKFCFSFARKCTKNVFKQVFQHKIGLNLTPTNEYLHRYRVLDSNSCDKCEEGELDVITHCLWECSSLQPFLRKILKNIKDWTGRIEDITMHSVTFR